MVEWKSLHIYYQEFEKHDYLIKNLLNPIISNLLDTDKLCKFFFIRYWEKGNHLRVRFSFNKKNSNSNELQYITSVVGDFLNKNPSSKRLIDDKDYNYWVNKENVGSKKIQLNNRAIWEQYNPEIERYGGSQGIRISEEFFYKSSLLIMKILSIRSLSYYEKLIIAYNFMNLYITKFCEYYKIDPAKYAYSYANSWLEFFNDGKFKSKILSTSKETHQKFRFEAANGYTKIWEELVCEHLESLTTLVNKKYITKEKAAEMSSSYIHMNNNRIGIKPKDEVLVSLILYRNLNTRW
ncbi:thiopeptide-type bacteriocin biosynthesis protein (plasmid) [Sutcliffiella horikoshii]|uniref:thiopeptide-type bacteriocin biosynthesis protein n=1 Tax=Sutcliffiella horikoshii TaxID=79883 RepID=UPI001CBF0D37|nr:thiopeptide-type bacteriocin biosynthesis protein [Sutcliffiella horikoshii]UAL49794.1 thiopeptide-type bacteriocin biosynthesis protein [Sutcliffiella horikoshii]